jgi:molybdopterin synthase catalytic subunit
MDSAKKKIKIQQEPIDIDKISNETGKECDGALVLFVGRPRNQSNERVVQYLTYEIFESMAVKELGIIADDCFSRWPVTQCTIVHRSGKVGIGEASVVIAVSSPHRQEAFDAVKFMIDMLKQTVPIWKTEHYSDGTNQVFDRS